MAGPTNDLGGDTNSGNGLAEGAQYATEQMENTPSPSKSSKKNAKKRAKKKQKEQTETVPDRGDIAPAAETSNVRVLQPSSSPPDGGLLSTPQSSAAEAGSKTRKATLLEPQP